MNNYQANPQYYIYIGREQIAVTEEVYRAYNRPFWAEHKRREREKRCMAENGARCTKDCSSCKNARSGSTLSLDLLAHDGLEPTDACDISKLAEKKELYETLYAAIEELEPKDRTIIRLFMCERSEREIAACVGLSQRGVNKRKNRIFQQLRTRLIDFR